MVMVVVILEYLIADQRIEGMFGMVTTQEHRITTTGPYYAINRGNGDEGGEHDEAYDVYFDSSRVVRTANESRPKNQSLLVIIKVKTV